VNHFYLLEGRSSLMVILREQFPYQDYYTSPFCQGFLFISVNLLDPQDHERDFMRFLDHCPCWDLPLLQKSKIATEIVVPRSSMKSFIEGSDLFSSFPRSSDELNIIPSFTGDHLDSAQSLVCFSPSLELSGDARILLEDFSSLYFHHFLSPAKAKGT